MSELASAPIVRVADFMVGVEQNRTVLVPVLEQPIIALSPSGPTVALIYPG